MRRSTRTFIFGITLFLVLEVLSSAQFRPWRRPSGDQNLSLDVGGVSRTYLLHVPKSLPEGKLVPLVLVFHGGGSRASSMPNFTRFDQLADEQSFLVAYPESVNRNWNDTRGLSPGDDVGFIRALIPELERTHGVDPKRVYAAGISNGGFFSNRLACELSDRIAAIASLAATMPESLVPVCKPSQPISVLYMHGTNDPIVHIDGGPVLHHRGIAISLQQASQFWRKWDQTSAKPSVKDFPDDAGDGTGIHREIYGGGKQGTEVVVYVIIGGGHAWPGASQYLPVFVIGKSSQNLDATQAIWDFFARHSLP